MVRRLERRDLVSAALALGSLALMPGSAHAQRVENGKAVFAALDKVTARISKLEAALGQSVQFGALTVTPRACYSRPPTEPPKTSTFVEIDETQLDGKKVRIFTGWIFAESPGLSAVEHPVYDLWLTDCTEPLRPATASAPAQRPATGGTAASATTPAAPGPANDAYSPRARPRR